MNYFRAPLADRLAAEYVLGTLRGPARRRFDALLPAHPALRAAVIRWQGALVPLAASILPVEPSARVWQGIEARLFAEKRAAHEPSALAPAGWWQRVLPWRAATGLATAVALALGVALGLPKPVQPPLVVVLSPADAAAAGALSKVRFVASVSADGRGLVLKPIDAVALDPQRALELWAVPGQGAPRSLGVVAAQGATTVIRTELLRNTAAFAVSIEPAGGSPTGAPTGPIISVGKLES
ncbi:anti-sigma factor [Ideonella sp. YS5]|uniref:anti-sigma factor n=1 Tax=Ideonella sp. YS5 TaxID=3453714 RepID=UPI003EECDD46